MLLDGKKEINSTATVVCNSAVANPERHASFSLCSGTGDGSNNSPAHWGSVGLTENLPNIGSWIAGVGFLPDQGGFSFSSAACAAADTRLFHKHAPFHKH